MAYVSNGAVLRHFKIRHFLLMYLNLFVLVYNKSFIPGHFKFRQIAGISTQEINELGGVYGKKKVSRSSQFKASLVKARGQHYNAL